MRPPDIASDVKLVVEAMRAGFDRELSALRATAATLSRDVEAHQRAHPWHAGLLEDSTHEQPQRKRAS